MSWCSDEREHRRQAEDDYRRGGRYGYDRGEYRNPWNDCSDAYTREFDRLRRDDERRREEREEENRREHQRYLLAEQQREEEYAVHKMGCGKRNHVTRQDQDGRLYEIEQRCNCGLDLLLNPPVASMLGQPITAAERDRISKDGP